MTRRGFRNLIILWWVAGISCVLVSLATNNYLPIELRNYLEALANAEPTLRDWIVIAIGFIVLIAAIVVTVGLYRFRPWAKSLLLPIHVIALMLMPFYGPSVMTGWASALSFLYSVLTGGLLFLVYLSPVGQMFVAQDDA